MPNWDTVNKNIQIIFEAEDKTGPGIAGVDKGLAGLEASLKSTDLSLGGITKGIGDLAGSLEQATAPFATLSKSILAFDSLVVGLAATLGSAAIKESREFEVSIAAVAKQLGDAGPPLEQVKKDIEEVGAAFGTNANEVATATADFLAAGYSYETAAKLVAASTNLMIAGDLDAVTATKAISASLAGFKIPASDAAEAAVHIGDVLNKIGDIGQGGIAEITDGFVKLAPTAKDAGWSMEQTAAAIEVIVATGYSGSEAANALKSGLVQLVDPPKEAAAALERMGVALKDSNGNQRLAGDIMADLAGKYGQLTDEQKLQTAAVIFGKDQAGKLNSLLGDWGKSQDYVAQMMDKTTGAVGSMAKEVDIKLALLDTKIKQTDEIWRQFLTHLGDKIVGGGDYEALIVSLGKLGEALKNVIDDGDLDPLIKPFQDAFATIGKLFEDMAKSLPAALELIDWSKFEDAIRDLTGSVNGMFDGIDLSTPDGLAKVIQTIIDLGAGLIKTSSGIIDGLKPLFEIIGSLVTGFANLDPEVQKVLGYFLGLATTVNTLSGYAKSFADVIGAGGGLIKSLSSLGPIALAVGTAFAAFEFGKWAGEVSGYNDAADKLIAKMHGVPDAATPAAEAIGRIPDNLKKVSESTGLAITSMDEFNKLADSGKIIWDDVAGAWVKAGDASGTLGEATTQLLDVQKDLNPSLAEQYKAMGLAADGTKKLADATKDGVLSQSDYKAGLAALDAALKDGSLTWDQYNVAVNQLDISAGKSKTALEGLSKSEEEAAKKTKDLAAESEKFALEWGKLLSAERIAVFQASADIQVAQIEADSKRAVAAMEMLSASFANTGDVLTELIGLWVGLEGMDQSKIEGWIEREYAIREKLAQAQIDMVNAEIRRLEAQTALLERGGVELKIQSDGLEPELEAFMFRIIDKVRVAVSGSYEEFLLGCGA